MQRGVKEFPVVVAILLFFSMARAEVGYLYFSDFDLDFIEGYPAYYEGGPCYPFWEIEATGEECEVLDCTMYLFYNFYWEFSIRFQYDPDDYGGARIHINMHDCSEACGVMLEFIACLICHDEPCAQFGFYPGCPYFFPDSVSTCSQSTAVEIPSGYSLGTNYPNPFNPLTVIPYTLREPGKVFLGIFNLQGALLTTLVDGWESLGDHSVLFDAGALPSGIYFYELRAADFVQVRKLMVVK
jgi:hypothetical protein